MFARFADGCCAFSPEKLKYINLDNDSVNELKVGMDAEYVLTEIALKSFEARLPSNVSTRMEMVNCRWKSLGDKMHLSKSCSLASFMPPLLLVHVLRRLHKQVSP